jgi:hypothetical protein
MPNAATTPCTLIISTYWDDKKIEFSLLELRYPTRLWLASPPNHHPKGSEELQERRRKEIQRETA